MVRRQALFLSDSEFQQLIHIFRLLGTPTEQQWPGVSSLRDWHVYPKWEPQDLARTAPSLATQGDDLLTKMLMYILRKDLQQKQHLTFSSEASL